MTTRENATVPADLARPYRVERGERFRIERVDPGDTGRLHDPELARAWLDQSKEVLTDLQDKLFAHDSWSLLLIFQGMDAAGKDGAIEHVMSGVNPQGCQVCSFKAPSAEELDHDFMWRCLRNLPERGRIGVWNRSHYEEVLTVRVHPELLRAQKLPEGVLGERLFDKRLHDIRNIERYLARNGVVIVKFFLHLSKAEQRRRFVKRLNEPEKHWKFSPDDVRERRHWNEYMRCYEQAIRATATAHAPWYVVPADHKWFTRLVVCRAIIDALRPLDLSYPRIDARTRRALAAARKELRAGRAP
jgi:PPK2 family polyphosphate:nucleotide phosphotransferase